MFLRLLFVCVFSYLREVSFVAGCAVCLVVAPVLAVIVIYYLFTRWFLFIITLG